MVLCALAGLPIATAVCASVCRWSETSTTPSSGSPLVQSMPQHHHESAHVHQVMPRPDQDRMVSTAAHECGASEDALLQSEAARTSDRRDVHVTGLVLSQALTSSAPQPLASPPGRAGDDSPMPACPFSSSSSRASLVLRV